MSTTRRRRRRTCLTATLATRRWESHTLTCLCLRRALTHAALFSNAPPACLPQSDDEEEEDGDERPRRVLCWRLSRSGLLLTRHSLTGKSKR